MNRKMKITLPLARPKLHDYGNLLISLLEHLSYSGFGNYKQEGNYLVLIHEIPANLKDIGIQQVIGRAKSFGCKVEIIEEGE